MKRELPAAFEAAIKDFGEDFSATLLEALRTSEPSVSVRANAAKGAFRPSDADPVAWEPSGLFLAQRPLFAADPAWHQGRYYVQDSSSMILGEAVRRIVATHFNDSEGLRYLDACAAPGGKTIAALDALPPGSFVVANEADRHRSNILAENIAKHGNPAVAISRGPAQRYASLPASFDIIAADVPCSGEGMMRKDPEAIAQWSPSLVAECAALQREIVFSLWTALRPGGVLIYSTCTFNRSENEDNIEWIARELGGESIDLRLSDFPGVLHGFGIAMHTYRLTPGFVRGEGLFIAALRKPTDAPAPKIKPAKNTAKKSADGRIFAEKYLPDADNYSIFDRGRIEAVPTGHADFARRLGERLDMLRCGLPIAELKGRELVPTHELAMSTALRRDALPCFELDYAGALAYLRGEALSDVPSTLPRGFALATYGGSPLGLVKNIGRRANNLYLDALRLRLDTASLSPCTPPVTLIQE